MVGALCFSCCVLQAVGCMAGCGFANFIGSLGLRNLNAEGLHRRGGVCVCVRVCDNMLH